MAFCDLNENNVPADSALFFFETYEEGGGGRDQGDVGEVFEWIFKKCTI
jgi:hypothetical protein